MLVLSLLFPSCRAVNCCGAWGEIWYLLGRITPLAPLKPLSPPPPWILRPSPSTINAFSPSLRFLVLDCCMATLRCTAYLSQVLLFPSSWIAPRYQPLRPVEYCTWPSAHAKEPIDFGCLTSGCIGDSIGDIPTSGTLLLIEPAASPEPAGTTILSMLVLCREFGYWIFGTNVSCTSFSHWVGNTPSVFTSQTSETELMR